MTSSKRIFCIFVILALMLSVPVVASAEGETTAVSGEFTYKVYTDGTACITGYSGAGGDVIIPSEIDGKVVSTIGDELFWYMEELTSVTLPENLEYIGARVFQNCTSLTEIKLPDTVAEIGDACFLGCANLSKINVPAKLSYVGAFAFDETPWITQFDGCTSVILGGRVFYKYLADADSVVVPDGVVCISDNAFEGKNLSFVSIPDSVAFIGDYAFYNCKNLKDIRIPSALYYLGENSIGLLPGTSEVVPVEGLTIYADADTIGAGYADMYKITLKKPEEFTEPVSLPEAEQCVPTGEIRYAENQEEDASVGLSQGAVIAIVLSIAGCVVIIGGVAVVSHFYEKKRRKEFKNNKKKKK